MEVFDFAAYSRFKWSDMRMILKATGVTLHVTLVSLAWGTLIGLILGLIRCSKNRVINKLPLIVMEPLRNSPLIVQLFLVFFQNAVTPFSQIMYSLTADSLFSGYL